MFSKAEKNGERVSGHNVCGTIAVMDGESSFLKVNSFNSAKTVK